jgi:hypothetical protein
MIEQDDRRDLTPLLYQFDQTVGFHCVKRAGPTRPATRPSKTQRLKKALGASHFKETVEKLRNTRASLTFFCPCSCIAN